MSVTDDMIEAGAQALADDVWHPPQLLSSLAKCEGNKFRRQARMVLEAAETVRRETETEQFRI